MRKILVTGGSGFLGSRVARYFATEYEVYAPSRHQMDITCQESVSRVVEAYCPDAIVHCAAVADIGKCQREPEKSRQINVEGSIHVVKAAKQVGAKCILCSSDQVYFAVPTNVYAQEKLAAEQACLQIDPDCVFVRLTWMYDPVPLEVSGHLDFFTGLLPKLLTRETVSYAVYDKRGITDVNQVVHNLPKALMLPGGVYDFGAPNDKTMYETAVALFGRLGLDASRVRENREAFAQQPRDIRVDQSVINGYGIWFADTVDVLVKNFKRYC